MNPLEQESLRFVSTVQGLYFEERDLEAVLGCLSDDVEWIGTGRKETCRGIRNARLYFAIEGANFKGSFDILRDEYEASALSDDLCMVSGEVCLRERGAPPNAQDLVLRISCVCRCGVGGLKLRQVHLSAPSSEQLEGDFFPRAFSEEGTGRLRRMLHERTAELEQINRGLNALTNNIPGAVICCDYTDQLNLIQYSEGFLSMFGYTDGELEARFHNHFAEMIYKSDLQSIWDDALAQLAKSNTKEIEYRVLCKDGSLMWVLDRGQLVENEYGERWFYCILIDITRTKKAQEELRLSLERHKIIMDQTTDIIFEWDVRSDTLSCSSNWHIKFGYEPIVEQASVRITQGSHLHPDDVEHFRQLAREVAEGAPYSEAEFRISNVKGRYIWCRIRASLQLDENGRPAKAVGVIIDIDQEKRKTQKLQEKAERDTLTGLYNKGTTKVLVEKCLAEDMGESTSALMIIDVDNFKLVNDVYGHLSGDAMLTDAAGALQKMFRSGDVVGRVGGDEFCVLMRNIRDGEIVVRKAKEVLKVFSDLLRQGETAERLSCSVGIALSPQDGTNYTTLFRNADVALYRAKEQGKNGYTFFMDAPGQERMPGAGLCLRTSVGAAIDSDRNAGVMNDRLAEYVFHVLYQSSDLETAIPLILEIVGRQFSVCRAYIFELSDDGRSFENTFVWCKEEARERFGSCLGKRYQCSDFTRQIDALRETGVFYCRDVSLLPSDSRTLMQEQGVRSALQCAIRDGSRLHGGIGFDDCRGNRLWTQRQVDTLAFVSEIVSAFLVKRRAQGREHRVIEHFKSVLNHQDNWALVVDQNTREVLYANDRARREAPGLRGGKNCREAFFGSGPCGDRPSGMEEWPDGMELYSPVLGRSISAKVDEIEWEDGRKALLLTCERREAAE